MNRIHTSSRNIENVKLNLNCRDEIIPILVALQHDYSTPSVRDTILNLIAKDVNQDSRRDIAERDSMTGRFLFCLRFVWAAIWTTTNCKIWRSNIELYVYEDAAGFIAYCFMLPRDAQDADVVVEHTKIVQDRHNHEIQDASFDRGFYSPENDEQLRAIIEHPRLPKKAASEYLKPT